MASKTLYPPIVDDYEPAFEAQGNCRIYFSLSKYNSIYDTQDPSLETLTVHISVMKQNNGITVINPIDEKTTISNSGEYTRMRQNGKMILNVHPNRDEENPNRFYVEITPSDIRSGQTIGQTYKVQLRLSSTFCKNEEINKQTTQLNEHANNFSEQSNVCVIKAISKMRLQVANPFNFDTSNANNNNIVSIKKILQDTIEFVGYVFSEEDDSEKLRSYIIKLYKKNSEDEYKLIENSGEIFSNKYQNVNEFKYLFKKEFEDQKNYKIEFTYQTINEYTQTYEFLFSIDYKQAVAPDVIIVTADNKEYVKLEHSHNIQHDTPGYKPFSNEGIIIPNNNKIIDQGLTSVMQEEEDGRIGIKFYSEAADQDCKNYCIRRTDEKSDFKDWEDISIFSIPIKKTFQDIPVFYDYTIESGIYYKYGIQEIREKSDNTLARSLMVVIEEPIMRDFQYSFLLGENNQQLRLQFDNTMQSFKIQISESKTETIGNRYPIMTRNAAVEYKIFPITGLISFQMDENHLFTTAEDIYDKGYSYHKKGHLGKVYDDIYERDFRKKVLEFLYNGKPKLFKSPTEGNVIVRLMDINCTPNQSLGRMIYSFSCTANEMAEATLSNYLKYKFYTLGELEYDFTETSLKIGQLSGVFKVGSQNNIISQIIEKYSSQKQKGSRYTQNIKNIFGMRIMVNDKPLRYEIVVPTDKTNETKVEYFLGNAISYKDNSNYIYFKNGIYDFDSRVKFYATDSLYFVGSVDELGSVNEIDANIDFIYTLELSKAEERVTETLDVERKMGQIMDVYPCNKSIFNDIYYRYYLDTNTEYQKMRKLAAIEIEADPGCRFTIKDEKDMGDGEVHEINETEILRIYDPVEIKDLIYSGKRNLKTGVVEEVPAGVKVTYWVDFEKGKYL